MEFTNPLSPFLPFPSCIGQTNFTSCPGGAPPAVEKKVKKKGKESSFIPAKCQHTIQVCVLFGQHPTLMSDLLFAACTNHFSLLRVFSEYRSVKPSDHQPATSVTTWSQSRITIVTWIQQRLSGESYVALICRLVAIATLVYSIHATRGFLSSSSSSILADLSACGTSSSTLQVLGKIADTANIVITCVTVASLAVQFGVVLGGFSSPFRLMGDSLVFLAFGSVCCFILYGVTVTFPITLYDVTVYFTAMSLKETYESMGLCSVDITQAETAVVSVCVVFLWQSVCVWHSISHNAWANASKDVAVVTGLAPNQPL